MDTKWTLGRFRRGRPKTLTDLGCWGERRDLNPRPSVPQTDALPTELRSPHDRLRLLRVLRIRTCPTMIIPGQARRPIPKPRGNAILHQHSRVWENRG